MKKILAIDAVGCLVDMKGNINKSISKILKKIDNKKIVLTNANDKEKKIFLKNISYDSFSLKHKPNKTNPKYYKKFLSKYKLQPNEIIYIEHDIRAVKSARLNGILTHHFDGNIQKFKNFLNSFLNKKQNFPNKKEINFHYYPHHPVVIGASNGKKVNFMPCVWNSGMSYEPFLYGVSVRKERYTNQILKKSRFFSINFLDFKDVNLIRSLGRSSGKLINKTKEFKVGYSNGYFSNVPILSKAYLSFECKKKFTKTYGTHTLFVGKVELIHTDNKISNKSILDISKVSPTLYLGADHYVSLNKKTLKNLKKIPFHKSYSARNIKLIT